jgi:hypothetical protein
MLVLDQQPGRISSSAAGIETHNSGGNFADDAKLNAQAVVRSTADC